MTRPKSELAPLLVAATLLAIPAEAVSQASVTLGPKPAQWTVEASIGARMPGTFYNEQVERRSRADSVPFQTRWKESMDLGLDTRLAFRLNPEAGVGFYIAGLAGWSNSTATYSGANVPPESISRSVRYTGLDLGLDLKLTEWAEGRGLLDYNVGAILIHQVIDLTPGHRDAFAFFGSGPPPRIDDWDSRSSTSWGLSLGTSFRIPISDVLALRTTFRALVIPVNVHDIEEQERADIRAFTGESALFHLRPYTTHQMTLSAGLEYTLSFGEARRTVRRVIPGVEGELQIDPVVANALRIAAAGDTATAIAALEHRVRIAPEDAYAWRELALLKAIRAEFDRSIRDEVLASLERALNMNPGDTELLRAYGRLRGLVQREGRTPEAAAITALEISAVSAQVDASGGLRLAWAVRGLLPTVDGGHRYSVSIEVYDEQGNAVPLGSSMDGLEPGPGSSLELVGAAADLPVSMAADLFLVQPQPGIYTARVRVTDLESGGTIEAVRGFEVPAPGR